ncbi:MAG: PfkB family carbohydrate kinase [Bacilli bacterium]
MATDLLVIGGSNIDFVASSRKPLILRDSNIGTLSVSYGGVGRNIAENLARLNNHVTFLTGLGKEENARNLKAELEALHVTVKSPDLPYPTGSYVAINDANGDMRVAVCDSQFLDNMKYEDILSFSSIIVSHKNIILDANLSESFINDLIEKNPDHGYFVEGVSANKVDRFAKVLDKLSLFKSNVLEASYLLQSVDSPEGLVKSLLERGVKNVALTNGKDPIVYGNKDGIGSIPIIPCTDIVSVNGAGDSLFAGLIHGLSHGQTLQESLVFGARMSIYTLHSAHAVNPDISSILEEFPWAKKDLPSTSSKLW